MHVRMYVYVCMHAQICIQVRICMLLSIRTLYDYLFYLLHSTYTGVSIHWVRLVELSLIMTTTDIGPFQPALVDGKVSYSQLENPCVPQ